MRNSTKTDASHYMATGLTTESLVPHFTLQLMRGNHRITSENSDYSKVIIITVAILIFIVAIITAIFIMLMQRRSHRRKLLLAAEIEKEEEDERERRLARIKHTPKRAPRKKKRMKRMGTPKSRKFNKPKTKEEMMMELSDFLETHSKKYGNPNEASIGSAEPTPALTPTVTPGLLSSEVNVSFHSPVAALRSPKLLSEDTQYPRISKKPHTPKYEKEVIYLTHSTEWGEKSEKKLAEVPSVPATPPSKSASPTHTKTGITGLRQPTPTAINHEESRENKSRELRSWNLESAEKEGYLEDRALEPWEEELQPSEKAEKEDEV